MLPLCVDDSKWWKVVRTVLALALQSSINFLHSFLLRSSSLVFVSPFWCNGTLVNLSTQALSCLHFLCILIGTSWENTQNEILEFAGGTAQYLEAWGNFNSIG